MNMDNIVKKANNIKKASMQSNQKSQISIKDYCTEGGKQSGQKRDSSQRIPPEDLQPMKKMDHGNNANNKSNPYDQIKYEDVTIQLIWNELKTNRKEQKEMYIFSMK